MNITSMVLLLTALCYSHSSWGKQGKPVPPPHCSKQLTAALLNGKFSGYWWQTQNPATKNDQHFRKTDFKASIVYDYAVTGPDVALQITDYKRKSLVRYNWNSRESCKESLTKSAVKNPRQPANALSFHDDDLRQLVAESKWGVIYAWTPYMPLSFMGFQEIRKAVTSRGGKLTIILDPGASSAHTSLVSEKYKLTSAELRILESDELRERGFGLHYPAAIIYHNGVLADAPYFGHKSADVYGRWIESELKKLGQGKAP